MSQPATHTSVLVQEAATGPEAWQIQLQCLLATASIQLPPCRLASSPQHTPASTPAFSTAMLSTVTSLADDLKKQPAWVSRVQAEGYSQAAGLAELLARVQWQLLDLVQGLYASLSGRSSASPPRRSLDVKASLVVSMTICGPLCTWQHFLHLPFMHTLHVSHHAQLCSLAAEQA